MTKPRQTKLENTMTDKENQTLQSIFLLAWGAGDERSGDMTDHWVFCSTMEAAEAEAKQLDDQWETLGTVFWVISKVVTISGAAR